MASNTNDSEKMEVCEDDDVEQLKATYPCQRQDGTYHDAEVLKTRVNELENKQEYYVHYVDLDGEENEWVDKTRLMLVDENGSENMSENENSPQHDNTEEEQPETKKRKVEDQNTESEHLDVELTCPLCNQLFDDPIMVECGHNFCRTCFLEAWGKQDSFTCPNCKEVIEEKRFTSNRTLANLMKKAGASLTIFTSPAKVLANEQARPSEKCALHEERVKLFCKDDGDFACIICRESLKHSNHSFLALLDAANEYRAEVSSIVTPLEEAIKVSEETTKKLNEKIKKHDTNVKECREYIESEFQFMYNFIKEREDKLLKQLEKEGDSLLVEMEAGVVKIQENIENMKQSITTANEKVKDTKSISFLTGIKLFLDKCQEQQHEATYFGPSLIDKDLNHKAYKAPILPSILEELDELTYTFKASTSDATPTTQTSTSTASPTTQTSTSTASPTTQTSTSTATPTTQTSTSTVIKPRREDKLKHPDKSKSKSKGADVPRCLDIPKDQKKIWIVGDLWVASALEVTKKSPYGKNLGFTNKYSVQWICDCKMVWQRLLPEIEKKTSLMGKPDILFLHLGILDVENRNPHRFLHEVEKDFKSLSEDYPKTTFVCLGLLPRPRWMNSLMENKRHFFNRKVSTAAVECGFLVAHFGDTEKMCMDRRSFGTALDSYLKDLKVCLERIMKNKKGPRRH